MIATADSKISSKIWEIKRRTTKVCVKEGPVPPSKVSKRWPAIMLAANRTASVPGRITFLTVSINTINGIKTPGVPCGTKWANICCVWLTQPKIIKVIHNGRDKDNVMTKCLELVNT